MKVFIYFIVINLFSTFGLFAKTIEYSNCIGGGRVILPKNIERSDNDSDYEVFDHGEFKVTQKLYDAYNRLYYGPDSNEVDKNYRGRWYYKTESYYGSETLDWSKSDYEKFQSRTMVHQLRHSFNDALHY